MALSANVPTKSIKKISKHIIKTDQKKTGTAKRKESYGIYNYKVLIQAHPVSRIHSNSIFKIRSIFHKINSSSYLLKLIHILKYSYHLIFTLLINFVFEFYY